MFWILNKVLAESNSCLSDCKYNLALATLAVSCKHTHFAHTRESSNNTHRPLPVSLWRDDANGSLKFSSVCCTVHFLRHWCRSHFPTHRFRLEVPPSLSWHAHHAKPFPPPSLKQQLPKHPNPIAGRSAESTRLCDLYTHFLVFLCTCVRGTPFSAHPHSVHTRIGLQSSWCRRWKPWSTPHWR